MENPIWRNITQGELKARLDGALGSLTWWLAALPEAGVGNEWSSMAIPTQSPSVIL